MLASYALHVEDSRGRRHSEPAHKYRNDFQRDRDRIIHSRAFRRLENKTQVFTNRYSDHFRNRLTHTIEVAQISRTIADILGLNSELVEALALVHDVGHPPFGHSGEKALNSCMEKFGESFDHNLHGLRIVEEFEERYASFPGLNLTFEVREGIIKHSRDYDAATHPQLSEYLLNKRPPLEAQLIDLTDEIAYNTADLDDGFEAKLLNLPQIRAAVPLFDREFQEVDKVYPTALRKLKFNEALKRMMDRLVTDLIENTRQRIKAAGVKTVEDVRNYPDRLAAFSQEVDQERGQAKEFLYKNLYYSDELREQKMDGERIVADLFEHWIEFPATLPSSYRRQISTEKYTHARVVCDYIAGMTDKYIMEQHRNLIQTTHPLV